MYYNALECDVPAETFWGSSIKEVNDMIYAYNRKKKEKIKEKISMQFLLADLIIDRMITLIDDKQKEVVREWDAFPELFEKEKEEYKNRNEEKRFEEYRKEEHNMQWNTIKEWDMKNSYTYSCGEEVRIEY